MYEFKCLTCEIKESNVTIVNCAPLFGECFPIGEDCCGPECSPEDGCSPECFPVEQ